MSEELPRDTASFRGEWKSPSAHSLKMWNGEVALGMLLGKGGGDFRYGTALRNADTSSTSPSHRRQYTLQ
jgi:hypothetical protein